MIIFKKKCSRSRTPFFFSPVIVEEDIAEGIAEDIALAEGMFLVLEDTALVEDIVDRHHLEAAAAAEDTVEPHTLVAAAAAVEVPPPSSSEVEVVDRNHTLEELLHLLARSSLEADLLPSPRDTPSVVVVVVRTLAVAEDWQTSFAAAAAALS